MKVLIDDGMQIKVGTGIGKYSKYLYDALKEKIDVDLIKYDEIQKQSRVLNRFKYMLFINSKKFISICEKYDVVHFTNYLMPFMKSRKCKYIVTIHDLASFIHPETLPRIYRLYNKYIIRHAMKHSDTIITVSNSVKNEIAKYFPQYCNKVKVIYPGLYDEFQYGNCEFEYKNEKLIKLEKRKFFLFVGTIEYRKNIKIIIDAFIRLKHKTNNKDIKLVLAGRPGFGYKDFVNEAEASGFLDDIIFTGYISKNDCMKLYNNALAYIFPSIYEGFGSTQLECMNCRLPLILSDIPTNREVSKDYGLFFRLEDMDILTEKMNDMIENNYNYFEKDILADKYLKDFCWKKMVLEYLEVYKIGEKS